MTTTLKSFIAQSGIPSKLIRSTVLQVGGWEAFKEMAQDVATYGANAGWSGFIYYTDTVAFTKRNKVDIIAYAKEQANDFGQSLAEYISSFSCLPDMAQDDVSEALYHYLSENRTTLYNALAWYALEEVARNYVDLNDQ